MAWYQIYSQSGVHFGRWSGRSTASALARLHRDAGYNVRCHHGRLIFSSPADAKVCGDISDWLIEEEERR